MELAAFIGFSGLAIAAALFILLSRNLVYAAFALFVAFLGVAALYVLAGADFLGVTQIMIYVGGVLVLLIFGIMLTRKVIRDEEPVHNRVEVQIGRSVWGYLIGAGVFAALIKIIFTSDFRMSGEEMSSRSTIKTIGVELMTGHLLPFEIAGVLLLAALVGAAYLAMNRNPPVNMIPLHYYLVVAAALFSIGLAIAVTKRHFIGILLGIELMLNAVNINLVAFSRHDPEKLGGQLFALFVIVVAAAEVTVALAIILRVYGQYKTVDPDEVSTMKK